MIPGLGRLLKKSAEVFSGNDAAAAQVGQKGDPLLVRCKRVVSLSWKLKVRVTGQPNARYTTLQNVAAGPHWEDGSVDLRDVNMTSPTVGMTSVIKGSGRRGGTCTAEADGWYLDRQMRVGINDGDDQTIDLVMKPLPWVEFNVVHYQTNARIPGVTIGAEIRKYQATSAPSNDPLPDTKNVLHEKLHPGSTAKNILVTHVDQLWEVVGDVVSTDS